MAFARHQFELLAPQADGQPLIEHLRAVEERTGRVPAMISKAPPLPEGCVELWNAFLRLHGNRGSTGWGPARITDADIVAAREARGLILDHWQVDMVNRVDSMWLSEFAPKPKADK